MTEQELIEYCYEHYPLIVYPETIEDIPQDILDEVKIILGVI